LTANTVGCLSKTDILGLTPVSIGLSPVEKENNKRMLVCDNANALSAVMINVLDIPEGVTELPISFDWRVASEDLTAAGGVRSTIVNQCYWTYDYFLGGMYYDCSLSYVSPRNDRVVVQLVNVNTKQVIDILSKKLTELKDTSPITSPMTGWNSNNWQTFTVPTNKPVLVSAGKYQLQVRLTNAGSDETGNAISTKGRTLFMVDRVRFRSN
jgi:hypothetical protein